MLAGEQDWDHTFEAALVGIVADFMRRRDPSREMCCIAEQERFVVGSALVVGESASVAQIQLLYVEPDMRHSVSGRN